MMAMVSPNSLHMMVGVPCACEEGDETEFRLMVQQTRMQTGKHVFY